MSSSGDWWEKRLGTRSILRNVADEPIPGGAKFTYVLGSVTLLTFLTLAATGIWELFWYVPSTNAAYDSVNFIRFQVPFGWLVHGVHAWAATLMVALVVLHLIQVFVWGAFKKPREMTWVLGVLLLVFTLGAVFTGGPLAWDEKGYWAARVGSGLAGSIPGIGPWLQSAVFGGSNVGQLTLSRLFPLHIAVIPILIGLLFALHLVAFRRGGAAGTIKESPRREGFWPRQVIMDLLVFCGVLTLLVGLSAFLANPVTGPADALDATYVARPDWPFLWLFQILKYLGAGLEWLGFVIVPLLGVALLLAVPWLDRKAERSPARRPFAMALLVVVLVAIVGLTWAALAPGAAVQAAAPGSAPATPASSLETTPTSTGPSLASRTIGGADHGQTLFEEYCQQCHGVAGVGNVPNPNSADGTVPPLNPMDPGISGIKKGKPTDVQAFIDNMDVFLQNGSVPSAKPENADPKYKMPSFGNTNALTQQQIADIESYVVQVNGVQRATVASSFVGPKAYFWWTLGGFVIVLIVSVMALVGVRPKE